MELKEITTDRAPRSRSPLSQAIRSGDLLFVSGQVAARPDGGGAVEGGIREQTRQVMENLAAVLEAGGSSMRGVVKTTCFLTDMEDFDAFNEVYSGYFPGTRPARSAFEVSRLAGPYVVEVEAIARVEEGGS
jgi:2-iminobutanoate/2-iminopropanoate deaminase